MDSVDQELNKLFLRDMMFKSITHDKVSKITYRVTCKFKHYKQFNLSS